MSLPFDPTGSMRAALAEAVRGYGPAVLANPQLLGNVLRDLLPDQNRERGVLTAAAESGIAQSLREQVEQGMNPYTAVDIASNALAQRTALSPDAARWAAAEFAVVMGYPVAAQPFPAPFPPPGPEAPPPAPPTLPFPSGGYNPQVPPAPPGGAFPPAATFPPGASGFPSGAATFPPGAATFPPGASGFPPGGPVGPPPVFPPQQTGAMFPPQQPAPGFPPRQPNQTRRGLIAAGAVAAVVVVYIGVAAAGHLPPFQPVASPSHGPTLTVPPSTTLPPSPTASTSPSPSLPSGILPLTSLLPGDLPDVQTDCQTSTAPANMTLVGVVSILTCADPSLPNGKIAGYQFDNAADYAADWSSFNQWLGFSADGAAGTCPAPSGQMGQTEFSNGVEPSDTQGQVLECGTSSDNAPIYVWNYPTDFAIIQAQGADGSSASALDTWWTNDAAPAAA